MDNKIMLYKLRYIRLEATKEVIRLADEAGVDRDRLFFDFASSLFNMAMEYSFAKFDLE